MDQFNLNTNIKKETGDNTSPSRQNEIEDYWSLIKNEPISNSGSPTHCNSNVCTEMTLTDYKKSLVLQALPEVYENGLNFIEIKDEPLDFYPEILSDVTDANNISINAPMSKAIEFTKIENKILIKDNLEEKKILSQSTRNRQKKSVPMHTIKNLASNSEIEFKNIIKSQLNQIPQNSYNCKMCKKRFPGANQLEKHFARRHNSTINSVKKFVNDLKITNLNKTDDLIYKCKVCSKTFNFAVTLDLHKRKHTGDKPFKCDHCSASFQQLILLKTHLLDHEAAGTYNCDRCPKTFYRQADLHVHEAEHFDFSCGVCEMLFKNLYALVKHVKGHSHEILACSVCSIDCKHRYKCGPCSRTFQYSGSFRRHQIIRHARPYQCLNCYRKFGKFRNLRSHNEICLQHDSFICDICGEKFRKIEALKGHLSQRCKRYFCMVCKNYFLKATSLIDHTRKCHLLLQ